MKSIKTIFLSTTLLLVSNNLVQAQNVNIPDAIFKAELVANAAINTNMDAEIQVSEAQAFSGTIDVNTKNIASLTGIETFTALTGLNCAFNMLTALNVSSNTDLTTLYCYGNSIATLNLSSNANLEDLNCSLNQLTMLNMNNNLALEKLTCNSNQLTTLNVSNNLALTELRCNGNQLTGINVSNNVGLLELYCAQNQLTNLNVSNNTVLVELGCYDNQLTYLNAKNGNNTIIINFNAVNNPNLLCIQVDDITYSTTNWLNKDVTASFNTTCSQPAIVNIPDSNFKAQLLLDLAINTNGDMEIQVTEAQAYSGSINVSNKNIASMTGIEAFTAVTILSCGQNQLTTLDVSSNTALFFLGCDLNQLTSLIVNNAPLTELYCNNNQLTNLDVSGLADLAVFWCYTNQLTTLDVSNNPDLAYLHCYNNNLGILDLSNNPVLTGLLCQNNQLSYLSVKNGNNSNIPNARFDATNNPNLTCIEVDNAAYSTTNWLNKDATATYSSICATNISNINNILPNLTAYPNPTTSNITLQLGEFQEQVTLSVINTMGQTILERAYKSTPQIDLELEDAAGIYFVRLQTAKGETMLKVVKE